MSKDSTTKDSSSSPPPVSSGWSTVSFVSRPPESLVCPICLNVLKDPRLTDCCGHHFCLYCIDRVQTCPICRKTDFRTFPNLEKKREVNSQVVYCVHRDYYGCQWTGQLSQLFESHLVNECHFVKRACQYSCGLTLSHIELAAHEEICPNIPTDVLIRNVKLEQISTRSVIGGLIEELQAVKKENEGLKRELDKLRERQKIELVKVLESQNEIHLQLEESRGRADVLERENAKIKKILEEVQKTTDQVDGKTSSVQEHVPSITGSSIHSLTQLESKIELMTLTCTSVPPLTLVLPTFSVYQANGSWWQSRPFYSHPCGYKFRMEVKPSGCGSGAGSHLSVYVHVMKGEFDEKLKWPLNATIGFKLIDHSSGGSHFESNVSFASDNKASARVTGDREAGTGRGYSQYLPILQVIGGGERGGADGSGLMPAQFLKNDSLVFEITKIVYK